VIPAEFITKVANYFLQSNPQNTVSFTLTFAIFVKMLSKSVVNCGLMRLMGKIEIKMESLEQDFAQIVREHKGTIYTVCYMFSKDEEEVADLFQDILINLWNGFQKFRGDCSLNTWVYRVSLNTCISSDRKKRRKGETVPLDMNINLFDDTGEDIKQIRMLQERISRLGPFDRAIVLLWLENMSYDEIGAIVGISAKNVSVRLFRIKEQLKKMSNQ
jgi:RNA polymerase sigma-70 factor (ECF subfamily)